MLGILFTILVVFFATNLFGYVVHWSLHQPWAGFVNTAHMVHHLKMYPSTDFFSDVYRQAGKDSAPKFFAIAAIPMVATPIVLGILGMLPLYLVLVALGVELLLGFLHDYLHDAFHIKNHLLTRIPVIKILFDKWVKLHYIHHIDMGKNYGIFTFHWDRLFGTFLSRF